MWRWAATWEIEPAISRLHATRSPSSRILDWSPPRSWRKPDRWTGWISRPTFQAIERSEGRVRKEHWGSRTLDLDIVRFGDRRVADPDLIIPHPELPNRDFWLRELAELQPHAR
jgi:hypothetical protein